MNTIIERIRAEVNRLKNDRAFFDDNQQLAYWEGLNKVSEKLSDLEKEREKKPTNIDFEQELYKHFGQVKDFTLGLQIGKYFYELGKQEKPTTAEGLEEEIERYLSAEWELDEDLNKDEPIYIYDCTWEDLKIFARHFAQWGAEHLKK